MKALPAILLIFTIIGPSNHTFLYSNSIASDIPEDAKLNFEQIIAKYGQKTEVYDVTTEDGYILKMFRVVGDLTKPILLIHGLIDSSDGFVMRGNTSLAIELARNNYDVWLINYRGNVHSRRHVRYDPDKDKAFWDFGLHEIGYYDMPATIDFVLRMTGQDKLTAIGYSQGTTAIYVMCATRPEYNDKVKVFISFAPICYLHNTGMLIKGLMKSAPLLYRVLQTLGINELLGFEPSFRAVYELLCTRKEWYDLCFYNGLFLLTGFDPDEVETEYFPVIVGHFPTGTSAKNVYHMTQIGNNRRFANYDYGPNRNLAVYGSKQPPLYDLGNVTMKIALFVAKNDPLSTLKDVMLLRKQLPNVVDYRVMKPDSFGHGSYVNGRNTHKMMHPQILEIFDRYK